MSRIVSTNLRLNLDNEADRRAWEYLQRMDRKKYKSYSRAIVAAINDHFDRLERLENDPYLETREKEDAFLQRVLDTVERGLQAAPPVSSLLQFLQTGIPMDAPAAQEDDQQDELNETALDFADSF